MSVQHRIGCRAGCMGCDGERCMFFLLAGDPLPSTSYVLPSKWRCEFARKDGAFCGVHAKMVRR